MQKHKTGAGDVRSKQKKESRAKETTTGDRSRREETGAGDRSRRQKKETAVEDKRSRLLH